jgi:uncharacterized protein YjdB
MSCTSNSVIAGQTATCTAVVQGAGAFNSAVTWKVTAGSISSAGLFTAPATATQVTITATSVEDATKSGSATVTVTAAAPTITSVTVSCAGNSVTAGQTDQCTATVQGTGAYSNAVTWQASGGTISSTGLFTAPAAAGQVTITATSTADTTKSGAATVSAVAAAPTVTAVTVTCAESSIVTGQTDQCTPTVQGTGKFSSAVTWKASGGTISDAGLLTAPSTAGQITITAQSVADTTKSGSYTVTVTAAEAISGVTLSCPESTLPQGLEEQCSASVQGAGTFDSTVTWQATAGSIASGLFTAPSTSGDVTITAVSVGDSTKSASAVVTVAAAQKAVFDYMGITHVSWWNTDYSTPQGVAAQDALAATSATWAGVLVTQYMDTKTSTTIAASSTQTPTDSDVEAAILEFHSKGLKVMLKPHVDVNDGTWRGAIAPSDVDTWFASFTTFITHYAQLAQANNVEMLDFGTEYATMSDGNLAQWTAVINAIRAVYTGKLTYGANATSAGDEFTSVTFWDQVDVIGLDNYFPLTNHADPTVEELVAAWKSNASGFKIVDAVANLASAYPTKPVIFTEIGYLSQAGTNEEPYAYGGSGPSDNTEQQNCYEAMYEVWSGSAVKGYFWWDWSTSTPSAGDTGYDPRTKPAQTVLQNWQ